MGLPQSHRATAMATSTADLVAYTANGGNINNGMNPIVNGKFSQQNYFANHNMIGMGGYNSNNMRPDMVLTGTMGHFASSSNRCTL